MAQREREKYEKIWKLFPNYRSLSPAEDLAPYYLKVFQEEIEEGDVLIDFGCGTGRAAKTFLSAHLRVELIDHCANCLDEEISLLTHMMPDRCRFWQSCLWNLSSKIPKGEWGFCCDVLEHIPPEKIDAALQSISQKISKGALFSIYLTEDQFGAAIGEPLHLTVQSKEWWLQRLKRYFSRVDCLLETPEWFVCSLSSTK